MRQALQRIVQMRFGLVSKAFRFPRTTNFNANILPK